MLAFLGNPICFQILSLLGAACVVTGCVAAASTYRGQKGQRFSPLNHYISELGETGVSRLAGVFNAGLILGGLAFLPACVSLGLVIPGIWSKLGMAAGATAAISVALVGVFPLNKLNAHIRAALAYFRLALLMIVCFTAAIVLQKETPPAAHPLLSLSGVPAILTSALFLASPRIAERLAQTTREDLEAGRPSVWLPALAEWGIFITTLMWFVVMAAGL